MTRWRLAIAGLAVALAAGRAAAASAPPVVVFVGPAEPERAARETRDALRALAARRATAFLDLSPESPPAPQAALHLARGVEAYVGFGYEAAREHLERGLAEAAATGAAGLTRTELSDLLIYRALAWHELGNATAAWDDFVRAAVVDATRRLDPARFAPSVVASFQRAVDAVRAAAPAKLSLALPEDCAAHLDGAPLAPRAGPIELARGEHYVRATCPGFAAYGARLLIANDQTLTPALRAPPARDDAALAALVRARGATAALIARLHADTAPASASSPAPTITLSLLGRLDDAAVAHRRVVLDLAAGTGAVIEAAERLLDAAARPALDLIAKPAARERPWYDRPWIWGAVGAAVAAALLVPFALDDEPADRFDVRPAGDTPP